MGVGVQLVQALSSKGEEEAVDMSLACLCETIDALGMTGFNKAYHNVQAFKDGKAPEMLTVSNAAYSAVLRGALHCIALHCIALHCIALHSIACLSRAHAVAAA